VSELAPTGDTVPLKAIPMLSKNERVTEAEKIRRDFVDSKKLSAPPEIPRKTKTRNFDK
jgi:hypothetical protein